MKKIVLAAFAALLMGCITKSMMQPMPLIQVRFTVPQLNTSCLARETTWQCWPTTTATNSTCTTNAQGLEVCLLGELSNREHEVWAQVLSGLRQVEEAGTTCLDLGRGGMLECIPQPEETLVTWDLTRNPNLECLEGTPSEPTAPTDPASIRASKCAGQR